MQAVQESVVIRSKFRGLSWDKKHQRLATDCLLGGPTLESHWLTKAFHCLQLAGAHLLGRKATTCW